MTISEGPGGIGTRIIKRKYPVVKGNQAGTTKQEGKEIDNVPEKGSLVRKEFRKGLK